MTAPTLTSLNRYVLSAVQLAGTPIAGITRSGGTLGAVIQQEISSGRVLPDLAAIRAIKPRCQFTSLWINTLLGAVGVMGCPIAGDTIFYYQKRQIGGTRQAGGKSVSLLTGMAVPTRLTLAHREDAQLTVECHATCDSTGNAPISLGSASAVPTFSDIERYTMGPVSVGATAIPGATRAEVDFGWRVTTDSADGNIYDDYSGIQAGQPKITVRGQTLDWLNSTGLVGVDTTLSIAIQKRLQGSTYDSANQLTLSVPLGMCHLEELAEASGTNDAEQGIVFSVRAAADAAWCTLALTSGH